MSDPQLALHEWSSLRSSLVWIYDQPVAPGSRKQTFLRKELHHAWLMREGNCRFTHSSGTFDLRPGMWLFVPFGRGRQEFSEDARMLSIRFLHQWPSGEAFIRNDAGLLFPSSQHPALERCANRLARLARGSIPDPGRYQLQQDQPVGAPTFHRLQSTFHTWLEIWLNVCFQHGLTWNRLNSSDDRLLLAARILNDAPIGEPFPRRRLLEQTHLSEVHLNRLFLNAFGFSPRKYWDRRRLEFVKSCLESSLMPVKEIAWRCGFKSDAHFAVWFRRLTGLSAGQHRTRSFP